MSKRMSSARGHASTLDRLLRLCYTRPACHKPSPRRHYSKQVSTPITNHEATDVAVLGGGITGLASAYYLSKELPKAKITLFEGSPRLGGWLQTKTWDVGNGKLVFELGPRTLRPAVPNGLVTLDLAHQLGLQDRLLLTKKESVGARNRFIYYPDHLVQMPSRGQSFAEVSFPFLFEPVFKGLLYGFISEIFKPPRDENVYDESVGSFISRRFGSSAADNIVSAVLHGVYAGDINQLSIRSIAPKLWLLESEDQSVIRGLFKQIRGRGMPMWKENRDLVLEPPKVNVRDLSVFTFVGGLGELVHTIAAELEKNPNVEVRREKQVIKLELNKKDPGTEMNLTFLDDRVRKRESFSHVISTIPGVKLDKIANIPPLGLTPAVTVMVVNVFFSSKNLLPVHGFGYLIPRSVPFSQNPEFALGVVFDSDVVAGQDTTPGTKVTVMLGGHWWNGWPSYPDLAEGAAMARAVLKRHLGITEQPRAIMASLGRNCIPQYTVGHDQRMWEASLMLERYEGRLRVAGSSYTGVGLNDCVRAAKDVVRGLVDGTGKNGLEKYVDGGPKWAWVPH